MNNSQSEIFSAFKKNIINNINPYLLTLGFNLDNPIKEEQQGIFAKYSKEETVISLSLSLHHLDYADGIIVFLKSKFGTKFLRNELHKKSSTDVPVYMYSLDLIDSEFERILNDIKEHFEKYLKE